MRRVFLWGEQTDPDAQEPSGVPPQVAVRILRRVRIEPTAQERVGGVVTEPLVLLKSDRLIHVLFLSFDVSLDLSLVRVK